MSDGPVIQWGSPSWIVGPATPNGIASLDEVMVDRLARHCVEGKMISVDGKLTFMAWQRPDCARPGR